MSGEVAAELAGQFRDLVGHPCGFGEVSAPNPVHYNLKVDEDQLAFFALLDAAVLDRLHAVDKTCRVHRSSPVSARVPRWA